MVAIFTKITPNRAIKYPKLPPSHSMKLAIYFRNDIMEMKRAERELSSNVEPFKTVARKC